MSTLITKGKKKQDLEPSIQRTIRVCFYVFFPAGGIGRYTNKLLSSIAAFTDADVRVACSPDYQWKVDPTYKSWDGLFSISHKIPVIRRARFLLGQFLSPFKFIDYVDRHQIDVVHFSNVNHLSFPFWRKALRRLGVRVVISVHDVKRQKKILNKKWEDEQLKAIYKFAHVLLVHSKCQEDELVQFAGVDRSRIQIVPHGPYAYQKPDASKKELRKIHGIKDQEEVALFFGQIRDEKNLDGLIDALSKRKSNPFLIVAGKGGGKNRSGEYYEQYAKALGVHHRIRFLTRYIPDEEVGELFSIADWVALPYLKNFTSQSGVLNVAVHFKKPVLVCSSPVLRETLESCDIGVICKNDSPDSIAKGMEEISSRMQHNYAFQFQKYEEQYSWKENAMRTMKVYERLLNIDR